MIDMPHEILPFEEGDEIKKSIANFIGEEELKILAHDRLVYQYKNRYYVNKDFDLIVYEKTN